MHSSQIEGDIDMETIHPQKSNVMVECNRERETLEALRGLRVVKKVMRKNSHILK